MLISDQYTFKSDIREDIVIYNLINGIYLPDWYEFEIRIGDIACVHHVATRTSVSG